jgi:hypothetical protein
MQDDEKEKSAVERNRSAYYKEQFMAGACTYNEWRQATGQDVVDWGDVRIFDLPPEQIAILKGGQILTSGGNGDGKVKEKILIS